MGKKPLSWKPRYDRKRLIYCAPACGGDCKTADHDRAKLIGEALAIRLGAGWKPHLNHNLGWHASVISPCGRIKLHPAILPNGTVKEYTAFLGEPGSGGRWVQDGSSPELAIAKVIRVAKADLVRMGAVLKGL